MYMRNLNRYADGFEVPLDPFYFHHRTIPMFTRYCTVISMLLAVWRSRRNSEEERGAMRGIFPSATKYKHHLGTRWGPILPLKYSCNPVAFPTTTVSLHLPEHLYSLEAPNSPVTIADSLISSNPQSCSAGVSHFPHILSYSTSADQVVFSQTNLKTLTSKCTAVVDMKTRPNSPTSSSVAPPPLRA